MQHHPNESLTRRQVLAFAISPLDLHSAPGLPPSGISSTTLIPDGNVSTITTPVFTSTRKITGANFHFTPVAGASLSTKDLTIDETDTSQRGTLIPNPVRTARSLPTQMSSISGQTPR